MREFGAAVFRTLGAYVVATAVTQSFYLIAGGWAVLLLVPGILFGVWIFRKADEMAARWWPDGPAPTMSFSADDLFRTLIAAIGVSFMLSAVPRLLQAVVAIIQFDVTGDPLPTREYALGLWRSVLGALLHLVVGPYLFFQTAGVLRLWRWARGRDGGEAVPR